MTRFSSCSGASTARILGLLGLAAALASPPTSLLAQSDTDTRSSSTGTVRVTLREVDGRPYNSTRDTKLSKEDCDDNVPLLFRLTGLPSGLDAPEQIWIMVGDSCNTEARRDGIGTDDCTTIGEDTYTLGRAEKDITLGLGDLCARQGDASIYFLFVDQIGTPESVTIFGTTPVPIDISPPTPPSNVKGGSGETSIPVEWTAGTGNPANYWVVWEPLDGASADDAEGADGNGGGLGAAAGATGSNDAGTDPAADADSGTNGGQTSDLGQCGQTRLIAGEQWDLDQRVEGIFAGETNGNTTTYKLDSRKIGKKFAAVAVIAEDLAGNRSALSNVVCIAVVPTDGFWDDYRSAGGTAEPGCACSVPSASRSPASALPVVLALFGLYLRRKRSRS